MSNFHLIIFDIAAVMIIEIRLQLLKFITHYQISWAWYDVNRAILKVTQIINFIIIFKFFNSWNNFLIKYAV